MKSRALVLVKFVAQVVALLLANCSHTPVALPTSTPFVPEDDDVWAGVAEGDITPPPGLSLFGHGPEGRVAVGLRLRLRCQAFVLMSRSDVIALVPCDLAAPDLLLQRAVAERLRQTTHIGGDRLLLMATHTHAGPAHYFGPRRYSSTFSSYQPGFDQGVFDFLAERIAGIVAEAYASRSPACVGWSIKQAYGLTRNRSYAPFAVNSSKPEILTKALELVNRAEEKRSRGLEPNLSPEDPQTYGQAAVDPTLAVLRIDARDSKAPPDKKCSPAGKPRGLFAVFGMHPTAIANTNDLYHGDTFGFATREIEACMRDNRRASCVEVPPSGDGAPFVAGIANGIEGDTSPLVDFQSPREARRIGQRLAHRILAAFDDSEGNLAARVDLSHAYRELKFPRALVSPESKERLCDAPSVGTAAAGGAEDGATRFRIVPELNEGRRLRVPAGCHGTKLQLIPPEGAATDDGLQFPAVAPISLLRIGDVSVATVPAEVTTVSGIRIREAIAERLGRKPVVVVGLTNSYIQYIATRDEYRYQHYEGASTLYGPGSSDFLISQFKCLATWLTSGRDGRCKLEQPFDVNKLYAIDSSPSPVVSRMPAADNEEDPIQLNDVDVLPAPQDGVPGWMIQWKGTSPRDMACREKLAIQVIGPDGTVVDDDTGSSMELRYDDGWTVRWLPNIAAGDPRCLKGGAYRIFVRSRVLVSSKPFAFDCSSPGLQ